MEIDKTTYDDLSIFDGNEDASVFHKLNFTRTTGGEAWLAKYFHQPFNNLQHITDTQKILGLILKNEQSWPVSITNGTIMVMEKFYDAPLDMIPPGANMANAYAYKFFHAPDYAIIKYSVAHFADFVRGMNQLLPLATETDCPAILASLLRRTKFLLSHEAIQSLIDSRPAPSFSVTQIAYYGFYLQSHFKNHALELIEIYSKLDAWYSMAMATKKFQFSFPSFSDRPQPFVNAGALYHPLLEAPMSYHVQLNQDTNFIFLTGANMAGKSTFIKAVGIAVFLAHIGMGVPAAKMELSLFNGILSNINVVDNIVKGESYFFNEVQRIKSTILKINNNNNWLVLIDELFKGTNVQDAMKCSSVVIEGLIKIKTSLFLLSTHLYEIGHELKKYPNIIFKYFETSVKDDQLEFSYQLKDGISNDRLGYLILKREKVVELLDSL
ncbi:MAG: DNA mismatch repair protein MutS [Bacteroidetes bacterium]|nr:DNA mismatch repair protein MutS [Bacteroidota bacterium]MBS1974075.1 DNA mismatch repair protein MutS [Bacteroidota bacterium]